MFIMIHKLQINHKESQWFHLFIRQIKMKERSVLYHIFAFISFATSSLKKRRRIFPDGDLQIEIEVHWRWRVIEVQWTHFGTSFTNFTPPVMCLYFDTFSAIFDKYCWDGKERKKSIERTGDKVYDILLTERFISTNDIRSNKFAHLNYYRSVLRSNIIITNSCIGYSNYSCISDQRMWQEKIFEFSRRDLQISILAFHRLNLFTWYPFTLINSFNRSTMYVRPSASI